MSSLKSLKIQAYLKLIPLKTEPIGDEYPLYHVQNSRFRVWQAKRPSCEGRFPSFLSTEKITALHKVSLAEFALSLPIID